MGWGPCDFVDITKREKKNISKEKAVPCTSTYTYVHAQTQI